jgi:heme exporter protein D
MSTSGVAGWLAMGGYAAYVWPAYAVTVVVLGGLAAASWHAYRRDKAALDRAQADRPRLGRERG